VRPRNRLDLGWSDLFAAASALAFSPVRKDVELELEQHFSQKQAALPVLSVRSGFDALLTALKLPEGSEVLVSAVTIRDMVRILEAHGLRAVPVDLDEQTLGVTQEALERTRTPQTRAILVAHLFGSRMPMDSIVEFAREHGLLLIEDCAQAWTGDDWRGHPQSDVALFSFGLIKTATAIGGGVLRFKDTALAQRVREVQSTWSTQSRLHYFSRVLKAGTLKLLSNPITYTLFVHVLAWMGSNHDSVLSNVLRGFSKDEFFQRIRRQPSTALLSLLNRRMRNTSQTREWVAARQQVAREAIDRLGGISRPGQSAAAHTHWVFPILCEAPDQVASRMWAAGFDATRGASSLHVLSGERSAPTAQAVMERILYLPVLNASGPGQLERLAQVLRG
jgi:dTDP-4-amino-4,6-dideoxygalactose transaminase